MELPINSVDSILDKILISSDPETTKLDENIKNHISYNEEHSNKQEIHISAESLIIDSTNLNNIKNEVNDINIENINNKNDIVFSSKCDINFTHLNNINDCFKDENIEDITNIHLNDAELSQNTDVNGEDINNKNNIVLSSKCDINSTQLNNSKDCIKDKNIEDIEYIHLIDAELTQNTDNLNDISTNLNEEQISDVSNIDNIPLTNFHNELNSMSSLEYNNIKFKKNLDMNDYLYTDATANKKESNFDEVLNINKNIIVDNKNGKNNIDFYTHVQGLGSHLSVNNIDLVNKPEILKDKKLDVKCFVRLVNCANLLRLCASHPILSTPITDTLDLFDKSNISKSLCRSNNYTDSNNKEFKKFKSVLRTEQTSLNTSISNLQSSLVKDNHSHNDRNLFEMDFLLENAPEKIDHYKPNQKNKINLSTLKFHPPFLRNMNLQPIILLEKIDVKEIMINRYLNEDNEFVNSRKHNTSDIYYKPQNKKQRFEENKCDNTSKTEKFEKRKSSENDKEKMKHKKYNSSIKQNLKLSKNTADLDRYIMNKQIKKLERKKEKERLESQDEVVAKQLEEAIRIKPEIKPKTSTISTVPNKRIPKISQLTDEDRARSVLAKIEVTTTPETSGWYSSRPPRYSNPHIPLDQSNQFPWRSKCHSTPRYPRYPNANHSLQPRPPFSYSNETHTYNISPMPYRTDFIRNNGYRNRFHRGNTFPIVPISDVCELEQTYESGVDDEVGNSNYDKKISPLMDNFEIAPHNFNNKSFSNFESNQHISQESLKTFESAQPLNGRKNFKHINGQRISKPLLPEPIQPVSPSFRTNNLPNILSTHPLIRNMTISQIIAALSEEDMTDRIIGSMSPNESVEFLQAVIVEAAKEGIMDMDECSLLRLVGSEVLAMDERPPLLPTPFDDSADIDHRTAPMSISDSRSSCIQSPESLADSNISFRQSIPSFGEVLQQDILTSKSMTIESSFVKRINQLSPEEQYLTKLEEESILIDVIISIQKELVGGITIEDHLEDDSNLSKMESSSINSLTNFSSNVDITNKEDDIKDILSPTSSITKEFKSTPNTNSTDTDKKTFPDMDKESLVIMYARSALKQHFHFGRITSTEYKEIMKKAIIKISESKASDISDKKVARFIDAYVDKTIHSRNRHNPTTSNSSFTTIATTTPTTNKITIS